MPCYDGRPSASEEAADNRAYAAEQKTEQVEAMLCGMVKAFGFDHVVAMVDWQKAGVTEQQFRDWWKAHRERDTLRDAVRAALED
jgi:hypothetical protein